MEYALNINDGRITDFNAEVARQVAYVKVPEDIAHAVANGELDWHLVTELVHKKRNAKDSTFSWEAFDKLRDQQNIRKAKYDPVEPDKAVDPIPDELPQMDISMEELTADSGQTDNFMELDKTETFDASTAEDKTSNVGRAHFDSPAAKKTAKTGKTKTLDLSGEE